MMKNSVQSELVALRDSLASGFNADLFVGLQNIRYLLAPGQAAAFVAELHLRNGYAVHKTFINAATDARIYLLRHPMVLISIIVEESATPLAGFPRLQSLCFQVYELSAIRNALQQNAIPFQEIFKGIETALLPGLTCRLVYTQATDLAWLQNEPFNSAQLPLVQTEAPAHLALIKEMDHIAYRIPRNDVMTVARLIMSLTPFRFEECYSVVDQKAETIVFRWGEQKPALVASFGWDASSVVQKYTNKYGGRVHHIAYYCEQVRELVTLQKENISFTTEEMIGGEDRGILQIFSNPSEYSHEITEYIQRFQGYRGFFDPGNVAALMGSTRAFN
jgi:4-hydroxyphenylpyruvate dioxygenase-like putative hemolysin